MLLICKVVLGTIKLYPTKTLYLARYRNHNAGYVISVVRIGDGKL